MLMLMFIIIRNLELVFALLKKYLKEETLNFQININPFPFSYLFIHAILKLKTLIPQLRPRIKEILKFSSFVKKMVKTKFL